MYVAGLQCDFLSVVDDVPFALGEEHYLGTGVVCMKSDGCSGNELAFHDAVLAVKEHFRAECFLSSLEIRDVLLFDAAEIYLHVIVVLVITNIPFLHRIQYICFYINLSFMRNLDTPCGRMDMLRWIPQFFFGLILFFLMYALASSVSSLENSVFHIFLNIAAGAAVLIVYALWVKLLEKRKASELSMDDFGRETGAGLLVGFGFFCAITLLLFLSGSYKVTDVNFNPVALITDFTFFFMVAVGEEVIFRGIFFRMIDERFNTWVALLISALVFGFVHIVNPGATVWSSTAIAIEAGIMLALAYKYSGSLWLPIGIHWAWNFTQGNIFGFSVSGGDAGNSLLTSSVNGPEFITGGAFGPEASILAASISLLISLYFLHQILQHCSA